MEIEAGDVESVKACLSDLGEIVAGKKTTSLSTKEVYKSYDIELSVIESLRFTD